MDDIFNLASEIAARPGYKRLLYKTEDAGSIKALDAQLTHAFQIFEVCHYIEHLTNTRSPSPLQVQSSISLRISQQQMAQMLRDAPGIVSNLACSLCCVPNNTPTRPVVHRRRELRSMSQKGSMSSVMLETAASSRSTTQGSELVSRAYTSTSHLSVRKSSRTSYGSCSSARAESSSTRSAASQLVRCSTCSVCMTERAHMSSGTRPTDGRTSYGRSMQRGASRRTYLFASHLRVLK